MICILYCISESNVQVDNEAMVSRMFRQKFGKQIILQKTSSATQYPKPLEVLPGDMYSVQRPGYVVCPDIYF